MMDAYDHNRLHVFVESFGKKDSLETKIDMVPILDNKEHLKQIVLFFGPHVFKKDTFNKTIIPLKILNFIIENFIDRSFLIDGEIIGNTDTIPDSIPGSEKQISIYLHQRF